MRRHLLLCTFIGIASAATSAHAERWLVGGHLIYAQPRGPFASVVDQGFGIQGFGLLNLDPVGVIGLRVDLGALNYGNEESTVPLSNTVQRVNVKVSTSNNIAMVGIGPQLTVPVGPVRPYAYATYGVGYFFTESSVKGSDSSNQPFASSTNYDDTAPAVSFGGGLMVPISRPVMLDLGMEYRRHRQVRYLTEGDIIEEPSGVTLRVHESDADLVLYRLGVTFGIF